MNEVELLEKLEEIFPADQFENLTSTTNAGSNAALAKEFDNHAKDFINQTPDVGVICFGKLDDKRYIVRHYISRKTPR